MGRAVITEMKRGPAGNLAGRIDHGGDHPTVDGAKRAAEEIAWSTHDDDALHWRRFSPVAWGLMDGDTYTFILVSWLGDEPDTNGLSAAT